MGTNYYHRTNICEACGRYKERHIGKLSFGWVFNFEGYEDEGLRLKSSRDWLRHLESDGKIFDEYGEEITIGDLRALIEKSKEGDTLNAADEEDCTRTFKDDDGYPITMCDFG